MLSTVVAVARRRPALAACAGVAISKRMKSFQAPLRDVRFLMNDVFDFESHYKSFPLGENATSDTINALLEAAAKFSENSLFPTYSNADHEGCTYVDHKTIKTPKGYKEAYDQYVESGWHGVSFPEKYGGSGLPASLSTIMAEFFSAGNFTWSMFPGLSKGAMNTLIAHGDENLKKKFLSDLVSGKSTGTMCLTEPHCGSDLAQVKTKAVPTGDGKYQITGTKVFISCGDHDLTENKLHCVLARLPNAPEGTKGISLFLVPKFLVDDEGNLGKYNNSNIGRIENKMGCHGSPTCEINFENSEGYLIGTENRGLNHMFTFINTSRIGTAIQGTVAAELSFQNALEYAKERLAMRSLTGAKNPEKPADPLIVHPDIRRMLLTQKCIAEGGRAMIYHCSKMHDLQQAAEAAGDEKEAASIENRLGFLTPVLKGFLTELGNEAASLGIQVWGGHGYIKDNMMEQIARDARIAPVWEGTTGIQALDLLGRKVMLQAMKPVAEFTAEINKLCYATISGNRGSGTSKYAIELLKLTWEWKSLTRKIGFGAMKNKDWIGSSSVDYLMFSGYVTMGYFWLQQAQAAQMKLKNASGSDRDFYQAKIDTAEFYFSRMLPRTQSLATLMKVPPTSVMTINADHMAIHH